MDLVVSYGPFEYLLDWTTSTLGHFHLGFALCAMFCGPLIFFTAKGTRSHRLVGSIFFVSMLLLNISALFTYSLTGSFNLFHAAAFFSLGTLLPAYYFVKRGQRTGNRQDFIRHGALMSWAYFGLIAAFVSEVFTREIPYMLHGDGGWIRFSVALVLYFIVTGWWTQRRINSTLARFAARQVAAD